MKKILILSLILIFPFLINSNQEKKISDSLSRRFEKYGPDHISSAWIFLKDKGENLPLQINQAREFLNHSTFKRRLRMCDDNNIVDQYDVPVNSRYLGEIKTKVLKIRHVSRWLNAISVEASAINLKNCAEFEFVKKITLVKVYKVPKAPSGYYKPQGKTTNILQVEHEQEYSLNYGPSFTQLNQINVPQMHERGYSGKGVIICMLDAGFNNLNHEALDHIDIIDTWDFVNNDPEVYDESDDMGSGSHGTKTLGTIAGFHEGELIGPAYNASFLLGKTENTEYERHIEEDNWIAAAEWAEARGADIISTSLSYRYEFTHGEEDYTNSDMDGESTIISRGANIAARKGVLIVTSAGNSGNSYPPRNTLGSPADCEDVLAVAAVDGSGLRANFSSVGPSADGRIKPDIAAMGQIVYVSSPYGTNQYDYSNGTSFSCPLVAGVAALLLEANPDWTNYDIMTALKQTASQFSLPDFLYGYGIINAENASNYQLKTVHAPIDFTVTKLEENYIFFTNYTQTIRWKVNPRNQNQVKTYKIFRKLYALNQQMIHLKDLDSTQTSYTLTYDSTGSIKLHSSLYKIIAVDEFGNESAPNYTRSW